MTAPAPGQAAYEAWRAAVPEWVCNVPGGPWEDLPETVRAGFAAIEAADELRLAAEADEARAERDRLRELLEEVGAMADGAPEDGDSPGVLEEIAMLVAAHGIPVGGGQAAGARPREGEPGNLVKGEVKCPDCEARRCPMRYVVARAAAAAGRDELAGELLGDLLEALGDDDDAAPEPGETPAHHAIRIAAYLRERVDELYRLAAGAEARELRDTLAAVRGALRGAPTAYLARREALALLEAAGLPSQPARQLEA